MKKLNNKGFAISTMLYGILTMVILVLALILNIMRSSYNNENAATENITYYLNKCISKQVALETCYKEYDDDATNLKNCSDEYETYISCMGNGGSSSVTGNVVYLNKLPIDLADEKDTGLIIDSTVTNGTRYIYTGENPNNYVKFGSVMCRIISIETDGTVKAMVDTPYTAKFDNAVNTTAANGLSAWSNSTIFNLLRGKFDNLEYSSKLIKGKFYTGTVLESDSTKSALTSVKSESTSNYSFGLPSLDDYLKASSNIKSSSSPTCNLSATSSSSLTTALTNCSKYNWMNKKAGTCSWTMTGVVSESAIRKYITYNSSKTYAMTSPTEQCLASMVIYFKSTTTIGEDGLGTSDSPFVVDLR